MKYVVTLLLTSLLTQIVVGQSNYNRFVQALIDGDTVLAKKISDDNTTTELIQTRLFTNKNIPEHVFNIESSKLKHTIISLFNIDNQLDNKFLSKIFYSEIPDGPNMTSSFLAESNKDKIFGKEYFLKPNTSEDIFLHNFREPWPSKFYFSQNHSLEYVANFIIRLNRIDGSSTKVSITADAPEVINGVLFFGVHGPVARYTSVLPTSIEEYTILEFIADKLGDKTLLPLRLPKSD